MVALFVVKINACAASADIAQDHTVGVTLKVLNSDGSFHLFLSTAHHAEWLVQPLDDSLNGSVKIDKHRNAEPFLPKPFEGLQNHRDFEGLHSLAHTQQSSQRIDRSVGWVLSSLTGFSLSFLHVCFDLPVNDGDLFRHLVVGGFEFITKVHRVVIDSTVLEVTGQILSCQSATFAAAVDGFVELGQMVVG